MKFYTKQHPFYCGVDLHAATMYVCILDADGNVVCHRNIATKPEAFLRLIKPYRDNLVVGAECMFTWYWLADLCADEGIDFVLGHALYMRAIHGGKAKNDKIDSHKIAVLMIGRGRISSMSNWRQTHRGELDTSGRNTLGRSARRRPHQSKTVRQPVGFDWRSAPLP